MPTTISVPVQDMLSQVSKVPEHYHSKRITALASSKLATGVIAGYKVQAPDSPATKYAYVERGIARDAMGTVLGNQQFTTPDSEDTTHAGKLARRVDVLAKGGLVATYSGPAYLFLQGKNVDGVAENEAVDFSVKVLMAARDKAYLYEGTAQQEEVNASVCIAKLTYAGGLLTAVEQTPGPAHKNGSVDGVSFERMVDTDDVVIKLEEHDSRIASLESEVALLWDSIDGQTPDLTQVWMRIYGLESAVPAAQADIMVLQGQVSDLQSELYSINQSLANMTVSQTTLQEYVAGQQLQIDAIQAGLIVLQGHDATLAAAIVTINGNLTTLEAAIVAMGLRVDALEVLVGGLQFQVSNLDSRVSALELGGGSGGGATQAQLDAIYAKIDSMHNAEVAREVLPGAFAGSLSVQFLGGKGNLVTPLNSAMLLDESPFVQGHWGIPAGFSFSNGNIIRDAVGAQSDINIWLSGQYAPTGLTFGTEYSYEVAFDFSQIPVGADFYFHNFDVDVHGLDTNQGLWRCLAGSYLEFVKDGPGQYRVIYASGIQGVFGPTGALVGSNMGGWVSIPVTGDIIQIKKIRSTSGRMLWSANGTVIFDQVDTVNAYSVFYTNVVAGTGLIWEPFVQFPGQTVPFEAVISSSGVEFFGPSLYGETGNSSVALSLIPLAKAMTVTRILGQTDGGAVRGIEVFSFAPDGTTYRTITPGAEVDLSADTIITPKLKLTLTSTDFPASSPAVKDVVVQSSAILPVSVLVAKQNEVIAAINANATPLSTPVAPL